MKVIFWDSKPKEIKKFISKLPAGEDFEFLAVSSEKELLSEIDQSDETDRHIVVLDLELKNKIESVNDWLRKEKPRVKRVFVSTKGDVSSLRNHQRSSDGGDAYFKKPLIADLFYEVLKDISPNNFNLIQQNSPDLFHEEELAKSIDEDSQSSWQADEDASTNIVNEKAESIVNRKSQNEEINLMPEDSDELSYDLDAEDKEDEFTSASKSVPPNNKIEKDQREVNFDFTMSDIEGSQLKEKNVNNSTETNEESETLNSFLLKTEENNDQGPIEELVEEKSSSGQGQEVVEIEMGVESLGLEELSLEVKNQARSGQKNQVFEEEIAGLEGLESIDDLEKNSNQQIDQEEDSTGEVDTLQTFPASVDTSSEDTLFSLEHEEELGVGIERASASNQSSPSNPHKNLTWSQLDKENKEFLNHHDEELVKLSAVVRNLREDRENLLKKIGILEEKNELLARDNLSLRAESDEFKIEISLLKRRRGEEIDALKYQLRLSEDKQTHLLAKNKEMEIEFERLGKKVRVDFQKIKEREKMLENQLELVKDDASLQMTNRENKILELKRKIDTLEFDLETVTVKDQKIKKTQFELEDKLEKVSRTLHSALGMLGQEPEDEMPNKVKYNLEKR